MCCLKDNRVGSKNLQPGNVWGGSMYKVDISTSIIQRLSSSKMWFVASTSVVLM